MYIPVNVPVRRVTTYQTWCRCVAVLTDPPQVNWLRLVLRLNKYVWFALVCLQPPRTLSNKCNVCVHWRVTTSRVQFPCEYKNPLCTIATQEQIRATSAVLLPVIAFTVTAHLYYICTRADQHIWALADLGGATDAPLWPQNFFIFVEFSGKIGQIIGWRSLGVGTSSLGNPGSATAGHVI